MSWQDVLDKFDANLQVLDPKRDPAMWNLNAGLSLLSEQLRRDIDNLESRLKSLASDIGHIR